MEERETTPLAHSDAAKMASVVFRPDVSVMASLLVEEVCGLTDENLALIQDERATCTTHEFKEVAEPTSLCRRQQSLEKLMCEAKMCDRLIRNAKLRAKLRAKETSHHELDFFEEIILEELRTIEKSLRCLEDMSDELEVSNINKIGERGTHKRNDEDEVYTTMETNSSEQDFINRNNQIVSQFVGDDGKDVLHDVQPNVSEQIIVISASAQPPLPPAEEYADDMPPPPPPDHNDHIRQGHSVPRISISNGDLSSIQDKGLEKIGKRRHVRYKSSQKKPRKEQLDLISKWNLKRQEENESLYEEDTIASIDRTFDWSTASHPDSNAIHLKLRKKLEDKKNGRAIDEWRAEQIRTGAARDNSNFAPVDGNWRDNVKLARRLERRKQKAKDNL